MDRSTNVCIIHLPQCLWCMNNEDEWRKSFCNTFPSPWKSIMAGMTDTLLCSHIFCTCLPACRQTFIKGNWGHSLNKLLKVLVTKAIECTKLHWSLFITRLLRDQGTHFKTLEVYFECVLKVHCCVADGFIASSSLVWLGQRWVVMGWRRVWSCCCGARFYAGFLRFLQLALAER